MLDQAFMNYTIPIFAVNDKGLISAKNYMAEITFPVVKIGAIASRYTDIDFECEKLSKAMFCGNEYSYFTMFNNGETLLFICIGSFGSGVLPFDILSLYKDRVDELSKVTPSERNKERRFVRSVHSNLIKVNYFSAFSKIFETKAEILSDNKNQKCVITKVYTGIKLATQNFLENVDAVFETDYSHTQRISQMSETDLISLILNALYFCIINAKGRINVLLEEKFDYVNLRFTFDSNSYFDSWLSANDNSALNSSLALTVAIEISKIYGIKYSLINNKQKYCTQNILEFIIPAKSEPGMTLSSSDNIIDSVYKYLNLIFLDETN